jgi:predicted TIM-barrel fold metal-dependent hydrolase
MTAIPLQTWPMRPADTNTPPSFELPAGACDAHFHVFEQGYPHVDKPQYTFPEGTLEQYFATAGFLGLTRGVLVQPTFYGDDNSLAVDVLKRAGGRLRAVVRLGEDVTDEVLDAYHELGVRAIRLDLFARADEPVRDLEAYITRMAARTRPRRWHLQFYTPGRVLRDLLPFLETFEDTFMIDHMGYMKEEESLTAADSERMLRVFADNESCWIKLSGAYRIAKDRPLSSVKDLGRSLVATCADRLTWGSDWPHLPNGQRDTGELLNLLPDWAPNAEDRQKILVASADRLFFDRT